MGRSEYVQRRLEQIRAERAAAAPRPDNPQLVCRPFRPDLERVAMRYEAEAYESGIGHVYVIRAIDIVKVGVTRYPKKRLYSLMNANPFVKDIYFLTPKSAAAYLIERDCHEALKPYWVRGEWFSCSPEAAKEAVVRCYERWKEYEIEVSV